MLSLSRPGRWWWPAPTRRKVSDCILRRTREGAKMCNPAFGWCTIVSESAWLTHMYRCNTIAPRLHAEKKTQHDRVPRNIIIIRCVVVLKRYFPSQLYRLRTGDKMKSLLVWSKTISGLALTSTRTKKVQSSKIPISDFELYILFMRRHGFGFF